MISTIHTVIHEIPLGQFAKCKLCWRVFPGKYEELVDAMGVTIYKCLCPVCAGSQMVARYEPSHRIEGASQT